VSTVLSRWRVPDEVDDVYHRARVYIHLNTHQEEIDVPESDPETPSPYTGKRGGNVETAEASMSESCTEVSISDRRYAA
jgi:hypothetical protein